MADKPQEYGPRDPSNQAATYPQQISPFPDTFGSDGLVGHNDPHEVLYEGREETSEIEAIVNTGLPPIHKKTLEHVFFLFRPFIAPILRANDKLRDDIRILVGEMRKQYMFDDTPVSISANVGYEVNYLNHRLLFIMAMQPLTILINGNPIALPVAQWVPLVYPRGTRVFAQGISDANPITVTIRACDELMALFASLQTGTNTIGNVGKVSDYPAGAIPITATSGNVANAVATATLAAAGAAKTWITGFEVTGSGATAALVVTVTVTNAAGNTLSYTYTFVTGVTTANQSLIVTFNEAIPTNAVNTAIAVSCPASGAGGTNNTVVAHGYQL